MADIYRRLGENLRRERERLGWTQEELGERAGLHPSYIGQIERCSKKVSLDTVDRLARALELPVSDLLDKGAPRARASNWKTRIDGILRDRTQSEKAFLYKTLKQLAHGLRSVR